MGVLSREPALEIRTGRTREFCRSPDRRLARAGHPCRIRRLRMPQLQAGRACGQASAHALRGASARCLPAFPAGGSPSACVACGAGGRSRGGAGQVLANARPPVREPEPPEAAPVARLRGKAGARDDALRRQHDGRAEPAAVARAHRGRRLERRARHANVLHQRKAPRRFMRPAASGRRRRSGSESLIVAAAMQSDILEKRREQAFPKLTARQIARLETHGERIDTRAGQVLVEPGLRHQKLYVVLEGSMEAVLPALQGESLITVLGPGEFSGELSTLRGVAGFSRLRARESGKVLAIDERKLRDIVQTDAELSELMMRAFILRRVGLVASGQGQIMLLGSRHSAATLQLREFLTRNAYPHVNVDLDGDADVQALLDRFQVGVEEVPVVIGHCGRVFRNPSIRDVAKYLQMNPAIDESKVHDLVVVGAGPAGLAAAVYAASEGLDVLVIETVAPGGQAGTSSKIENYLGFPTGISGQALAGRAFVQAQKFG